MGTDRRFRCSMSSSYAPSGGASSLTMDQAALERASRGLSARRQPVVTFAKAESRSSPRGAVGP